MARLIDENEDVSFDQEVFINANGDIIFRMGTEDNPFPYILLTPLEAKRLAISLESIVSEYKAGL